MKDKQFIFIIGSPRSGTTWLQIMIGAHPQVCTSVELTLFDKYIAAWRQFWKKEAADIEHGRWNKGLPFLCTEDEFYGFLMKFIKKVYERVIATNPQATHILDKNPDYALYVEDINKCLPNARFVHIIRDGRDVAVSMISARQQIGFGPDTIEGAAKFWKRNVQAAQKARQYHNQYMEVRYEDLLSGGIETLKSVFNFCSLPAPMKEVAAIVDTHQFEQMKVKRQHADKRAKTHKAFYRKGKAGSWQDDLPPIQRYIFDRIAGDLLRELGYAADGWWADSGMQKLALPTRFMISKGGNRIRRAARVLLKGR